MRFVEEVYDHLIYARRTNIIYADEMLAQILAEEILKMQSADVSGISDAINRHIIKQIISLNGKK